MLIGLAVLIILICAGGVHVFKTLVRSRNSVDEAWRDMEKILDRRHALAKDLADLVKKLTGDEVSLPDVADKEPENDPLLFVETERILSRQISDILSAADASLGQTSDRQHLEFVSRLSQTGEEMKSAYRKYNDAVRAYNTRIHCFPGNLLAARCGFEKESYLEANFAAGPDQSGTGV